MRVQLNHYVQVCPVLYRPVLYHPVLYRPVLFGPEPQTAQVSCAVKLRPVLSPGPVMDVCWVPLCTCAGSVHRAACKGVACAA
eukprot:3577614-Rhodomonas_salina.1